MNILRLAVVACPLFMAAGPALAQDEAGTPPDSGHRDWSEYRDTIVVGNIFSRERGGRAAEVTERERRESSRDSEEDERDREPSAPADPADNFVFRGVSYVGDTARAFFEDRQSGAIHILIVGDTLGDRRIRAIELDRVELASGDTSRSEETDRVRFAGVPELNPGGFNALHEVIAQWKIAEPAEGDREGDSVGHEPYVIEVGMTLSGEDVGGDSSVSASISRPSPGASSGGSAEDESVSDGDDDVGEGELSIEERMRRRREQQLNQ